MSNLLSNCVKYAQPHTRVYIDAMKQDDQHVSIVVKNISKDILNISSEELMERFVRGDASRSSEGSGLGLNIAESLCTIMNGSFEISVDGDLFKTCIILPAAE
jgi:signal transduction histidine kinase